MTDFEQQFPNYFVTQDGVVYKNGEVLKPFKSNKYLQVVLYDNQHKRHIFGVHTLVAMIYLDGFYAGCVVHHKDRNCHNNTLSNLEIHSRVEHSREHGKEYCACGEHNKKYGSWNKGKHLSDEHRKNLSKSAKKYHARKRVNLNIEG